MMKLFLKIVLVVCIGMFFWCKPLFAQEIIWEKALHLEYESFYSVCESNDGQILAGGLTTKFGYTHPSVGEIYGSALVKISHEGDSIWIKKMPYSGYVKNLCPTFNGLIWAVFQVRQPNPQVGNDLMFFPAVALLANDSSVLIKRSFPELNTFQLGDSYLTADGGLILFGSRSPSFIPGLGSDFYALKVDALGQLQWSRPYNPGPTNSFCQGSHVEPMANGNFSVSGSMGRRIVSFEINPETGVESNYIEWFQNPGSHIIYSGAATQSTNLHKIVTGSIQSPSPKFYISRYDSAGLKIFGGASLLGSVPPYANNDGSSVLLTATDVNTRYLSRLKSDSTDVWKVQLTTDIPGRKSFYDMLYSENGTGYIVGSNTRTGRSDDFYIAKFSGIGEPFDPTGVKQPHLVKTDGLPYPNPTNTSFKFKKEFQKGEVYLFSIMGKRVHAEPQLLPNCSIDVSGLAAGTYLYRAVLDGKPHWGKIIKN